ncbi:SidA/IucD/PvdA family monooxygenase [candidate division KSB3 bacterium]|uniref:SidA/IucD/PvdA family monooxygenase n=1 Tax=candidate division KSB3 bacterium TaxID=2044937 RepID=A0A9D5Q6G0_9BACT|nr:SidA/IucD/PvdA family monooxygenase [candidate division KSB3 bacterium]MBD3325212.1 SidA/IucD/PvdA family monooxygenase [candidate division KSB3 bacterium]
MKSYDVVVIGASAAGVTAAITAKRHYPKKPILLVRKEQLVPIPCGIPYAFGVVGTPDKNLIPADTILSKNQIDGIVDEVVEIDRDNRQIITASGERIGYQKLVMATGSEPIIPPIPGNTGKQNVFAIKKDVPYLQQVIEHMERANNLCIIGCGFIGVEIAEECRRRRPEMNICIVEMLTHCLQLVYDEDFCIRAEDTLKKKGICLLLDEKVEGFLGNGTVSKIKLSSGKEIDTDMVIMGIGAAANTTLAEKSGLEVGPTKGVQVNRYMQTSDHHIYACGDCAEKVSFFDGKPTGLKLASIATMEARVAGANLFATNRINMGVIGVYSTVLGDCAFAAAGLTKSQAVEKGYDVVEGESESVNRHPGCMPGGSNLRVKLLFEAGSQILLGGQVTGAKSGGELINTISACIHQRMTADDIATFQTGTHPALTASPIAYQLVNAAEVAIQQMKSR